jgi:hypothetical protein
MSNEQEYQREEDVRSATSEPLQRRTKTRHREVAYVCLSETVAAMIAEVVRSSKQLGYVKRVRAALIQLVTSQSLAVVNVKKGGRLTEFNFCGQESPHVVCALAAKTEFCKPDPNTWNAGA